MKTTVLYEDQLAVGQQPSQYVPHLVMLDMLSDRLNVPLYELSEAFAAHPCKGRDKLVQELDRRRDEPTIIAVLDNDRIRELKHGDFPRLRFEPKLSDDQIVALFQQEFGSHVSVILLDQNLESLLRVVCEVVNIDFPQSKPTPLRRDELLKRARGPNNREVREQVLGRLPSFLNLVVAAERVWTTRQ